MLTHQKQSNLIKYNRNFFPFQHPEFSFLLKERVCPLVIKLFSPSLKYRPGVPAPPSPSPMDKPYFPIVMRLLRIVAVLLKHYYKLLVRLLLLNIYILILLRGKITNEQIFNVYAHIRSGIHACTMLLPFHPVTSVETISFFPQQSNAHFIFNRQTVTRVV